MKNNDAAKRLIHPQEKINSKNKNEPRAMVETICALDIKPTSISWLWVGWLAAGKFHVLGGTPGTGKTSISLSLASILSRGGKWPDGSNASSGDILMWSGEDDPSDTLVPRLSKANADLSRVHFISGISHQGTKRSFDPATDIDLLRRKIEEIGNVKLLIIDPIVSAISGDSHKNAEVRKSLQPLADLAAYFGIALIGITHLTKGTSGREPIERITGSLAFGALARIVLIAAKSQKKDENGNTSHIFMRAKSNIGPDEDGFEYNIQQDTLEEYPDITTSFVAWGEGVKGSAKELLAVMENTPKCNKLNEAKDFLTDLLKDGPLPQSIVRERCNKKQISWATARRAQKELGIKPYKNGNGPWLWALDS